MSMKRGLLLNYIIDCMQKARFATGKSGFFAGDVLVFETIHPMKESHFPLQNSSRRGKLMEVL